jgi:TolB-like protein
VFLSYASQDAGAALRICEALRAAGIEVFLDQSELRGGDAWDQKIRQQIQACALFMPVVSQHTQERLEGYFRLEWKLAVDRSHLMATERPFLVPVVVDATRDQDAFVPDAFRAVQWTHLPGGETPPDFAGRIRRLLSPQLAPLSAMPGAASATTGAVRRTSRRSKRILLAIVAAVVVAAALAYFLVDRSRTPQHAAPAAVFAPPPHSVAVLPFVNMSGDKEQEYFSDGLTEELLNSLAEISQLQVAARTSAFSFKGKDTDIGTIARKLNVAAVLEGSVRRSGNTVRITAQLINAVTGFHLWSHSYDRDLTDILKLQTEIADAVANALKISLLGDVAARIELGGTRNPAALDAYLRGRKLYLLSVHVGANTQTMIDAYGEAIRLDPNYALAYANRSLGFTGMAEEKSGPAAGELLEKGRADALKAIGLAPDLAEGHLALALYVENVDLTQANEAYEKALALGPGNARVLRDYAAFAVAIGHTAAGIAAARRAVVLDPLNPASHGYLGGALYSGRRYTESIEAFRHSLALDPDNWPPYVLSGLAYYALGDFQNARTSCEAKPPVWKSEQCLAITYDKLGRHADAENMLSKLKAWGGDNATYLYATVYAQWGDATQALGLLETALRQKDPMLEYLKTDPLLDPLRKEPRFQAIERELKYPP